TVRPHRPRPGPYGGPRRSRGGSAVNARFPATSIASQGGTPRPGLLAQVAGLVRPWRRQLALVVACVIGAALAGVVPPLVIRHVVNDNLLTHRTAGLLPAGLAYLAAVAAIAGLSYAYSFLAAVVAQRAIAAVRVRLF